MRSIPLRDFQREGAKALGAAAAAAPEPWLLTGREHEFLLLPLQPESRMAILDLAEGLAAVAALRQDQMRAVEAGLDQLSMDEIDEEIRAARREARQRKGKP